MGTYIDGDYIVYNGNLFKLTPFFLFLNDMLYLLTVDEGNKNNFFLEQRGCKKD